MVRLAHLLTFVALCAAVSVAAAAQSQPAPDALARSLQQRYQGIKDFRVWWLLFVGIILAIYGFFLWFRFQHPVKMLPW